MSPDRLPSDWVRAVLPVCILQAIASGCEAYGYQIIQSLRASGFDGLSGGTVYPALNRLEADGFVHSEWRQGEAGAGKKFYSLTPRGQERLQETTLEWANFVDLINNLLHKRG